MFSEDQIKNINKTNNYLSHNMYPHTPLTKSCNIINLTKCTMLLFCLLLTLLSQNFTTRSLLYTAIHGSYGLLWILKEVYFPDKSFQKVISLGSGLSLFLFLCLYYLIPYTAICGDFEMDINKGRILAVVLLYILGVFFMMCSDAQKNFTLLIKKGLISNGLFFNTRNPNYFGEILIYLSFAIMAESWGIYFMLVFIWVVFFGMRMIIKDSMSLKKKEGAEEYFKRSYLLFPKVFERDEKNLGLYVALGAFLMLLIRL